MPPERYISTRMERVAESRLRCTSYVSSCEPLSPHISLSNSCSLSPRHREPDARRNLAQCDTTMQPIKGQRNATQQPRQSWGRAECALGQPRTASATASSLTARYTRFDPFRSRCTAWHPTCQVPVQSLSYLEKPSLRYERDQSR